MFYSEQLLGKKAPLGAVWCVREQRLDPQTAMGSVALPPHRARASMGCSADFVPTASCGHEVALRQVARSPTLSAHPSLLRGELAMTTTTALGEARLSLHVAGLRLMATRDANV